MSINIVGELSGNRLRICLLGFGPGIGNFGWLFQSTPLDPCADARAVGGRRPFNYDRRPWPDLALENRHRVSRQALSNGCSNPTVLVVALTRRLADDLKKQLAD